MDTDDTQLDVGADTLGNRKENILKGFILKTTGLQKNTHNHNAKSLIQEKKIKSQIWNRKSLF